MIEANVGTHRPIDYLYRARDRAPDAVAVAGPGDPISYRALTERVDALAVAFQSLAPSDDGRIAICAPNTVPHLVAMLAVFAAGRTWVPLNPRNGRAELDAMIAVAGPTLLIVDPSCVDRFTHPPVPMVSTIDDPSLGFPSLDSLGGAFPGRHPARVARPADATQIIKFSGGSTGTPKAVAQPIRALEAQLVGIRSTFELAADDVNLIAAPITHGASCFVLPVLAAGGSHVLVADARPARVLDALERYGITTCYAPPTLIHALLTDPSISGRRFPALRHLIYSAAPMSPPAIREAQRVFGPVVETAYGQVEAPQIVTAMRAGELREDRNLASIGRATAVADVSIVDAGGNPVGPGAVGEIVVRGPLVMTGYLGRPDLTATTLVDGALHTGDLATMDERGYISLRGRLRDVINTGGFKVHPGDVEAALLRHSAVAECCVFGADDPRWGEAVHAAVVLTPDAVVSPEELIAHVKGELDSVKAPKRVHIVAELPRNPAGKVSRADVRSRLSSPGA